MNKKRLYGLAVFVVAAVAAGIMQVDLYNQTNFSNLSLKDIEALARQEEPTITCNRTCDAEGSIGQCWKPDCTNPPCIFTGDQTDYCTCR